MTTTSSADQKSVNEAAVSLTLDSQDGFLSTLAPIYTAARASLAMFLEAAFDTEPNLASVWFAKHIEKNFRVYCERNEVTTSLLDALCFPVNGAARQLRPLKRDKELNTLVLENDLETFLLQACDQSAPTALSSETPDEQATSLNESFKAPYKGTAVEMFVNGLEVYDRLYSWTEHYGRIIPIIQSSGTGKSRLVAEVGKQMPTFSVCFRGDTRPIAGWPHRDLGRDFFQDLPSHFYGEEMAAAFLGALAHIAHEAIASLPKRNRKGKGDAKARAVAQLNAWMTPWQIEDPTALDQSNRHKTFAKVMERTKKILADNAVALKGKPNTGESHRNKEQRKGILQWHLRIFELLSVPGRS